MNDKAPPALGLPQLERGLLGSMILHPRLIPQVMELLQPDQFYRHEHGWLFATLRERYVRGEPIDPIILGEVIHQRGATPYGGLAYVVELPDVAVPEGAAIPYAREIRAIAIRRSQRGALTSALDSIHAADDSDWERICESTATALVSPNVAGARAGPRPLGEVVRSAVREAREVRAGQRKPPMPTGLAELDALLDGGMRAGDLNIIGGRPSMGKTAALCRMAEGMLDRGHGIGFISLEMRAEVLCSRWVTGIGELPMGTLRDPMQATEDDLAAIDAMADHVEERGWALEIDDRPGLTLDQIVAVVRDWKLRGVGAHRVPLSAVIVDYIQIVGLPRGARHSDRPALIGEIGNGLKHRVARGFEVAVLAGAQVGREVESRDDKRPHSRDLKESGQLEQDADVIAMLYRPVMHERNARADLAEIILRKQRNGRIGTAHVRWDPKLARFDSHGPGLAPTPEGPEFGPPTTAPRTEAARLPLRGGNRRRTK